MIVDLPRRWRWAIGMAVVFAAAVVVWFLVAMRVAEEAVAVPLAAVVPSPSAPASEPAAAAAAAAVLPGEAPAGDQVEVCGGGWIKLGEDGMPTEADVAGRPMQRPAARERILARMRSSPDEFVRAAALLATPGDLAAKAEALARIATTTSDERLYATAFKLCHGKPWSKQGTCQMIDAARWAQLDPGNAMPMLFLLDAAKSRGDAGALDDALYRVAVSQRNQIDFMGAAAAVVASAPDDEDSTLAAYGLAAELIGIDAAAQLPSFQSVLVSCRGDALKDTNRAQTCAAVAEVLAERSDNVIDRMIGARMGRDLGWPTERSDRIRGEYAAYTADLMPFGSDHNFSCERMQSELHRVSRIAQLGEVGDLREWVARSGKKPEDFVLLERARQQQAQRAAREAAASAAAASAAS